MISIGHFGYRLVVDEASTQDGKVLCFVGGIPMIDKGVPLPACGLCSAPQTFFFQVRFPDDHAWSGLVLAIFACTSCMDDKHVIPRMLEGELFGADIPSGFLDEYQVNFRTIVCPVEGAVARLDYGRERVRYKKLRAIPVKATEACESRLGGLPAWLLGDETPRSYAGRGEMSFLMQLAAQQRFEISPEAPPQIELGLDGKPRPSRDPWYELFLGNQLYAFGTPKEDPKVYLLTQRD